ncbi:MAG: DUF4912 domain-containing protein [Rhodospirillales bacterium]|nr:DUF4912 domain-containing protein [Rhodospirillales bacterium]
MEPPVTADTSKSSGGRPVVDLDPAFLRRTGEEARAFFPRPLTDIELVLIDVDPNHIHVFWNIPPAVIEAARARTGGGEGSMVLRLYPADHGVGSAERLIEVDAGGLQGRTYVGVWQAERRFRGMIGLRTGGDDLMVLATSNEVTLPPTGPVPNLLAEPAPAVEAAPEAAGDADPFGALYDLEAVLPVSSYILAGERVAFEATAELHINGRADPGATVRLFGRTVPVRPDGSFSVVCVLPQQSRALSMLLAAAAAESESDGSA